MLVVNEATTNCVEHAYREMDAGLMRVEATLQRGEICVSVRDFGTWKTPDPQPRTRGRGLPMMRAVSEHVEVNSSPSGTTVEMTFPLGGSS